MKRAKITRFKVFLISSLLVLLPSLCLAQETYIWIDGGMKRIEPKKEKPSDKGSPALDKYIDQGSDKDASEQEKALQKTEELEEQQRAEEIEKARREYEEAKKSEMNYRTRNNYTGNRRTRYLWKQSLQRLETAKQRLEELEKTQ